MIFNGINLMRYLAIFIIILLVYLFFKNRFSIKDTFADDSMILDNITLNRRNITSNTGDIIRNSIQYSSNGNNLFRFVISVKNNEKNSDELFKHIIPKITFDKMDTLSVKFVNRPIDCVLSDWKKGSFYPPQPPQKKIPENQQYLYSINNQDCKFTCGGEGKKGQRYYRTILTEANYGGKLCESLSKNLDCNIQPCPINCKMTDWYNVDSELKAKTSCLKNGQPHTCGAGGLQRQKKDITTKPNITGKICTHDSYWNSEKREGILNLKDYEKDGYFERLVPCNTQPCPPVDCVMNDWFNSGKCVAKDPNKDCGPGTIKQKRTIKISPKFGGKECPKDIERNIDCNDLDPCPIPVNCKLSEWKNVEGAVCIPPNQDVTCGVKGKINQIRTVLEPERDGGVCSGPNYSRERILENGCDLDPCPPIDCQYSEWKPLGKCIGKCGSKGIQKQNRMILRESDHGGKPCNEPLEREDPIKCDTAPCPKTENVADNTLVDLTNLQSSAGDIQQLLNTQSQQTTTIDNTPTTTNNSGNASTNNATTNNATTNNATTNNATTNNAATNNATNNSGNASIDNFTNYEHFEVETKYSCKILEDRLECNLYVVSKIPNLKLFYIKLENSTKHDFIDNITVNVHPNKISDSDLEKMEKDSNIDIIFIDNNFLPDFAEGKAVMSKSELDKKKDGKAIGTNSSNLNTDFALNNFNTLDAQTRLRLEEKYKSDPCFIKFRDNIERCENDERCMIHPVENVCITKERYIADMYGNDKCLIKSKDDPEYCKKDKNCLFHPILKTCTSSTRYQQELNQRYKNDKCFKKYKNDTVRCKNDSSCIIHPIHKVCISKKTYIEETFNKDSCYQMSKKDPEYCKKDKNCMVHPTLKNCVSVFGYQKHLDDIYKNDKCYKKYKNDLSKCKNDPDCMIHPDHNVCISKTTYLEEQFGTDSCYQKSKIDPESCKNDPNCVVHPIYGNCLSKKALAKHIDQLYGDDECYKKSKLNPNYCLTNPNCIIHPKHKVCISKETYLKEAFGSDMCYQKSLKDPNYCKKNKNCMVHPIYGNCLSMDAYVKHLDDIYGTDSCYKEFKNNPSNCKNNPNCMIHPKHKICISKSTYIDEEFGMDDCYIKSKKDPNYCKKNKNCMVHPIYGNCLSKQAYQNHLNKLYNDDDCYKKYKNNPSKCKNDKNCILHPKHKTCISKERYLEESFGMDDCYQKSKIDPDYCKKNKNCMVHPIYGNCLSKEAYQRHLDELYNDDDCYKKYKNNPSQCKNDKKCIIHPKHKTCISKERYLEETFGMDDCYQRSKIDPNYCKRNKNCMVHPIHGNCLSKEAYQKHLDDLYSSDDCYKKYKNDPTQCKNDPKCMVHPEHNVCLGIDTYLEETYGSDDCYIKYKNNPEQCKFDSNCKFDSKYNSCYNNPFAKNDSNTQFNNLNNNMYNKNNTKFNDILKNNKNNDLKNNLSDTKNNKFKKEKDIMDVLPTLTLQELNKFIEKLKMANSNDPTVKNIIKFIHDLIDIKFKISKDYKTIDKRRKHQEKIEESRYLKRPSMDNISQKNVRGVGNIFSPRIIIKKKKDESSDDFENNTNQYSQVPFNSTPKFIANDINTKNMINKHSSDYWLNSPNYCGNKIKCQRKGLNEKISKNLYEKQFKNFYSTYPKAQNKPAFVHCVPQKKCLQQPVPVFNSQTYHDANVNSSVGSILPKFKYQETYHPNNYNILGEE